MSNIKDICEVDRILPIHQLNKINEKGTERQTFFPISVVQAIFDKTGIRLDAIISSFNYLFLPWKGTKEDTRLQVVGLMRRKSLVICYRDLDDNVIIEMYNSNERGDEEWKKDDNWKDFADWLHQVIENILDNLEDYENLKDIIMQLFDTYLNEYGKAYIKQLFDEYTETIDIEELVNTVFNNYIKSDEFNQLLTNTVNNQTSDIVNNYIGENMQPIVDTYMEKVSEYLKNNERVIANALSRHEEDINTMKIENNG